MPDRYWVGGSANWDATAGTKWAATSGGAGGETVPTTADDVYFDVNSTGTVNVTVSNTGAKSINCTGFTGTFTGTGAMTIAGSITLVAGMTYTHTGTITLTDTGTLTTAGKSFSTLVVNGVGITVTLGDALNTQTRTITVTAGGFDTAGYSVTAGALISSNTNNRTIALGASTVTLSTTNFLNFITSTNLTFDAGTSQINASISTANMRGGDKTFYNVSFTSTGATTDAAFPRIISGANTFNNLTLNASASGLSQLALFANQTVNGTFTCAGSSAVARGFVRSDAIGTTRTITAAAVSASDCDFRDITIAGAAAPIAPTRAGDCGGNSGITFPAAKTVYRVGGNTTWAGSSSWALTSGGSGSNDNFPLAQDAAVINNDTALTGTLALAIYNIGSLDCSARTTSITLNHNAVAVRHGDYVLGSGVTVSGTSGQAFSGRNAQIFTSAGKTITFTASIEKPTGAFELGDAFSSSGSISLVQGAFDAKNYAVTCATFNANVNRVRTLTMGSGLWTLTGTGSVWNIAIATGLTLNQDTADVLLSNTTTTARTFAGGGFTYNKLTIGGATGTSTTSVTGVNTFSELASTKTVAHTARFAANQTVDTWSITGTSGNVVTVDSSVAGTRRTITLTNQTSGIDYLSVRDIGTPVAGRFYVGTNSTNVSNNLNIEFSDPPPAPPPTGNTSNFFLFFGTG